MIDELKVKDGLCLTRKVSRVVHVERRYADRAWFDRAVPAINIPGVSVAVLNGDHIEISDRLVVAMNIGRVPFSARRRPRWEWVR